MKRDTGETRDTIMTGGIERARKGASVLLGQVDIIL